MSYDSIAITANKIIDLFDSFANMIDKLIKRIYAVALKFNLWINECVYCFKKDALKKMADQKINLRIKLRCFSTLVRISFSHKIRQFCLRGELNKIER